jgi:hypothetical protein
VAAHNRDPKIPHLGDARCQQGEQETIQTIMEELQPEAAYFSEGRGVAAPALPYALMQRSAWKGFSQKAGIPEGSSVVILAH